MTKRMTIIRAVDASVEMILLKPHHIGVVQFIQIVFADASECVAMPAQVVGIGFGAVVFKTNLPTFFP